MELFVEPTHLICNAQRTRICGVQMSLNEHTIPPIDKRSHQALIKNSRPGSSWSMTFTMGCRTCGWTVLVFVSRAARSVQYVIRIIHIMSTVLNSYLIQCDSIIFLMLYVYIVSYPIGTLWYALSYLIELSYKNIVLCFEIAVITTCSMLIIIVQLVLI